MKKIISILSGWMFASKRSRFLLGVTIIALLIRLAIILFASNPQHPEMYEHGAIAHNLYTGHGFAMHWPYEPLDSVRAALLKQPIQHENAYQPPLNPYLIYSSYLLFGENSSAIIFLMLLYSVISSLIPIAVFKTGMLIGHEKAARISAVIAVFFLPAAVGVITFSGSPIYQLLGVVVFYFALLSAQKPSLLSFLWLGASCGIMILTRSEFLIIGFVFIALSTFFARKKDTTKKALGLGVVSLLICISIVAPWTYRNYILFHKFIPTVDRPWHEIWRGNNIYSTPTSYDTAGMPIWVHASRFPKIIEAMDSLPYDQQFTIRVDSIFRHEATTFIKDHPVHFVELGALKIFELCTVVYYKGVSNNPLYFICMLLVNITSILGILALLRQSRRMHDYSVSAFFITFFLYYCFIVVLTFILPRYQIYIFSALLPATGVGVDWLKTFFRLRVSFLRPKN
ncbi:MAG: ArnT family glycosyltransferase [Candidatus Kapaibacterium sp.]